MTLRVVVLGGGFGGVAVARGLGNRARVTLVSQDNFLLFTPMLAEVAAGDVDPRHIVTPVRQLCPQARFLQGMAESVDLERRVVVVRPPLGREPVEVGFEVLVLALGSVPATFGVSGVEEAALPFKTIGDALRIRNRLLALLELAAERGDPGLVRVAVVGAGYSGAELAAALADALRRSADRFFPGGPPPQVLLVDAVDRVTPALGPGLSRAAEAALRGRGVELVLGRKVSAVDAGGITLEDGSRVAAATVVWAAGVRPHPLTATLGLEAAGGRLVVDRWLRAGPGVFALGDMAAVPAGEGVSAPTAQAALRQGAYLGRHLPALAGGRRRPPFSARPLGELVSLGHRNAVGRVLGVPVSGLLAWFLWRSYYLLRLPTLLRKARVALDWTLDLVFPPDIAWLPSSDLGPDT